MTFSENEVVDTLASFSDSNCSNKLLEWKITATFSVGGQSVLSGYNDMTFQISKQTIQVFSTTQANSYNSTNYSSSCGSATGYCGFTNWTVGVARDVTGLNHCQSGCVFSAAGTLKYTNFFLGNASGSIMRKTTPINALAFGGLNVTDRGFIALGGNSSPPASISLQAPLMKP